MILEKKFLLFLQHELICRKISRLFRRLEQHHARLKCCFSEEEIAQIDKDFTELHRAYRSEPERKIFIDSIKEKNISFQDAWATLLSRFAILKEFCGGIATVISQHSNCRE